MLGVSTDYGVFSARHELAAPPVYWYVQGILAVTPNSWDIAEEFGAAPTVQASITSNQPSDYPLKAPKLPIRRMTSCTC